MRKFGHELKGNILQALLHIIRLKEKACWFSHCTALQNSWVPIQHLELLRTGSVNTACFYSYGLLKYFVYSLGSIRNVINQDTITKVFLCCPSWGLQNTMQDRLQLCCKPPSLVFCEFNCIKHLRSQFLYVCDLKVCVYSWLYVKRGYFKE